MSMIDLHIELSKANYFTELICELDSVIKKKKGFLKKLQEKNRKIETLSPDEKDYYDCLIKKENEIIADFLKSKKWIDVPENILNKFAEEINCGKNE